MRLLLCVAAGVCAGLAGGLFGLGGGVIIVPFLLFVLHFDQHKAQGTSLFTLALPVAALGAYKYFSHGEVNVPAALSVAVGMVLGSFLGSRIAHNLKSSAMRRAFCTFVALVGVYLFFKSEILHVQVHDLSQDLPLWALPVSLLAGVVAGMTGGLFGVGGGVVIVPFFVLALGFPQHLAQGTSLLVLTLPVAAVGAHHYFKQGNVDLNAGFGVACGVLLGSFLGSSLALGLDPVTMQRAFAVFVVCMAMYLFFKRPARNDEPTEA